MRVTSTIILVLAVSFCISSVIAADCQASGIKNPRTCAQAVQWAEAHISTQYNADYYEMCDHTVGLAYGYGASGFESADVHWNSIPAKYKHNDDRNPPAGALIFFAIGQYGHIALSTGGNNCISTDINGKGTLTRSTISDITSRWGAQYRGNCKNYSV